MIADPPPRWARAAIDRLAEHGHGATWQDFSVITTSGPRATIVLWESRGVVGVRITAEIITAWAGDQDDSEEHYLADVLDAALEAEMHRREL